MCGGFIVAYSASKISSDTSKIRQLAMHVLYSIGRVFSYAIIGAIFGTMGSVFLPSKISHGFLLWIAAILMLVTALALSGKFAWLNNLEFPLARLSFVQSLFRKTIKSTSLHSFFALGVLNGFLPCGLVYFFAASAAASASAMYGALIMVVFGLSTIPALSIFGFFVGLAKNTSFRTFMINVASVVIIFYSCYLSYKGYLFIFDPVYTSLKCH